MPELLGGVYYEEGIGHGQQVRDDSRAIIKVNTDESLTWKPERTVHPYQATEKRKHLPQEVLVSNKELTSSHQAGFCRGNVGDKMEYLLNIILCHPWRRKWQPTSVHLLREFHGQRSLAG